MMTESAKHKINERWVWRGSVASVKNRQISFAAIVESVIVCVSLWTAEIMRPGFFAPYSLIVAALAAPVLLMKSDHSIALGVAMMRRYWTPVQSDTWSGAEWYEKVALFVIVVLVSFLSSSVAYELLIRLHTYGALWSCITTTLIGTFTGGAMTASLKGNITLHAYSRLAVRLPLIACMIGAAIAVGWLQSSLMYACLSAIQTYIVLEGVLWSIPIEDERRDARYSYIGTFRLRDGHLALLFALIGAVPYLTGLVIRVVFIRLCATLRYPIAGIKNIPNNWADNLLRVDPFVPASLIPDGDSVSSQISTSAQLSIMASSDRMFIKLITILGWAICFVPALIYRWSLKGSLWAWWPMGIYLLLVRPEMTKDERVNFAKRIISRVNRTLVAAIPGTAFILLGYSRSENPWLSTQPWSGLLQAISRELPVSTLGMRWWTILGLIILPSILFYQATQLSALFQKELDERRVYKLNHFNRTLFLHLCETTQLLWVTVVFCAMEAFWWTFLDAYEQKLFGGFPFTSFPMWR